MTFETNNDYKHLMYRRGYLFGEKNLGKPFSHWNTINIQQYVFHYDNDKCYTKYAIDGDNWILIYGNVIDIIDETNNLEVICNNLLKIASSTLHSFYEKLDVLSGRYVILLYNDGELKVFNDATGMRTVCYSVNENILSSHSTLLKELINADDFTEIDNNWSVEYGTYHIPGHFTPYEDIYFLTPNTLLNFNKKKIERFYPRHDIGYRDVKEVAKEIISLVKAQLHILSDSYDKFLFSLSAGIDSRTTLSLLKDFKDKTQCFTYYKVTDNETYSSKSLNVDKDVVEDIIKNLDMNHRFIVIDEKSNHADYLAFEEVMKNNTFRSHNLKLTKKYLEELDGDALHIRSNILEIGRSFYSKNRKLPVKMDANAMANCMSVKAKDNDKVSHLFKQFYDLVEMDKINNYDPYDMLYWEYRMGTWHALLVQESDVAHDTFIPFNCRKILELFLSVTKAQRKKNYVFSEIINQSWPVLNYWNINSRINLNDIIDRETSDHGITLTNAKYQSGNIYDNNRTVNYEYNNYVTKSRFKLLDITPKKGDYAELILPIDYNNLQNKSLVMQIRNSYENSKNKGRIVYQILVNNQPILEEDIALWKETNQIFINLNEVNGVDDNGISSIAIRVIAVKNCEPWGWAEAGAITVERISLRNLISNTRFIKSSSPYSSILIHANEA